MAEKKFPQAAATAPVAPPVSDSDSWAGAIYLALCSATGFALIVYYNTTSEVMGAGAGLALAPVLAFIYRAILGVFRK